jgi:Na+/phosphate symporter
MLTILVPLAVCIVGVLIYALATNPKPTTIGLVLFAIGAFWTARDVQDQAMSVGATPSSHTR